MRNRIVNFAVKKVSGEVIHGNIYTLWRVNHFASLVNVAILTNSYYPPRHDLTVS